MRTRGRAGFSGVIVAAAAIAEMPASPGAATHPSADHTITVVVSLPCLADLAAPALPRSAQVSGLGRGSAGVHGAEAPPSVIQRALSADLLIYASDDAEPAMARLARRRAARGRPSVAFIEGADAEGQAHTHEHDGTGVGREHPWLDPALVAMALPGFVQRVEAAADGPRTPGAADRGVRDAREVAGAFAAASGALDGSWCVSVHGALDAALVDAGVRVLPPLLTSHASGVTARAIARLAELSGGRGRVILLLDAPFPTGLVGALERGLGVRVRAVDVTSGVNWETMMRTALRAILDAALEPPGARRGRDPGRAGSSEAGLAEPLAGRGVEGLRDGEEGFQARQVRAPLDG